GSDGQSVRRCYSAEYELWLREHHDKRSGVSKTQEASCTCSGRGREWGFVAGGLEMRSSWPITPGLVGQAMHDNLQGTPPLVCTAVFGRRVAFEVRRRHIARRLITSLLRCKSVALVPSPPPPRSTGSSGYLAWRCRLRTFKDLHHWHSWRGPFFGVLFVG